MEIPLKPVKHILSRQLTPKAYRKEVAKLALLVEEFVDTTANVLDWALRDPKANRIPALQLRHVVEQVDGISVLVRQGCAEPCKSLLRSCLESMVGMEYILEKDTERRETAYEFYQWTKYAARIAEHAKHTEGHLKKMAEAEVTDWEKKLVAPRFADFSKQWRAKPRPSNWYSFDGGPKDFRQLCDHVNRSDSYRILYKQWSETTHAANVLQKVRADKEIGKVHVAAIRDWKDLQMVVSFSLHFSLISSKLFASKYFPDRVSEIDRWYFDRVRDRYLSVASDPIFVAH